MYDAKLLKKQYWSDDEKNEFESCNLTGLLRALESAESYHIELALSCGIEAINYESLKDMIVNVESLKENY